MIWKDKAISVFLLVFFILLPVAGHSAITCCEPLKACTPSTCVTSAAVQSETVKCVVSYKSYVYELPAKYDDSSSTHKGHFTCGTNITISQMKSGHLSDLPLYFTPYKCAPLCAPDTTPPTISSIASSSITSAGATISWTTNEASDTQVEYGITTGYGSSTTLSTGLVTAHSQTLSGLLSSKIYHYRVKSKDAAGNIATSGDNSFTTSAVSTSAPSFRFVAWADTEDDGGPGNAVLTAASKIVKNLNPAFTIYPGDMVKCTDSNSCWQAGAAELKTALNGGSNNGIFDKTFGSRGNHENKADAAWKALFDFSKTATNVGATNYDFMAGADDMTYSFDYGNSHVVGIDMTGGSVTAMSPTQIDWLDKDLAAAEKRPGITHAFLFWHGPIYWVGKHKFSSLPSGLVTALNKHPFIAAGFFGHEMVLTYTHIDSGRISGITSTTEFESFVVGNVGDGSNSFDSSRVDYGVSTTYGFVAVDVSCNTFNVSMYKFSGASATTATLDKKYSFTNGAGGCTSTSDTTPPSAVTNLAAANPTPSSVTLSWTAPGDDGSTGTASQYDVRYSTSLITSTNFGSATSASGEPTPSTAGSAQTFIVSGLVANTKYYFAMKTADDVPNWSGLSNIPSATTTSTTTVPSAPTLLASAGNIQVTLSWSVPSSTGGSAITGYRIYRIIGIDPEAVIADVSSSTLSYTDSGRVNGQELTYSVSAKNSIGEGARSDEVIVTPQAPVDNTPYVVSASPLTGAKNVPLKSQIIFEFSEPMNKASVVSAATLKIVPVTAYTIAWSAAADSLTLTPRNNLIPNKHYAVVLEKTAKSSSGVAMAAPYVLAFDTSKPLEINVISPANNSLFNTNRTYANITTGVANWCDTHLNGLSQHMAGTGTSWHLNPTAREGKNNMSFQCTDSAGNIWNSPVLYFNVDTVKPALNLFAPALVNGSFAKINITSSENLSTAILEWNRTNSTMAGSERKWYATIGALAYGNNTFKVYGKDAAGNWNYSSGRIYANLTRITYNKISLNARDRSGIISSAKISINNGSQETSATSSIVRDVASGARYTINFVLPSASLSIRNLVLTKNTSISPIFVNADAPQYITPKSVAVVLNDSDISYSYGFAEITLPVTGTVNRILHCNNWNFANNTCVNWHSNKTSDYKAIINSTHIRFNVTHFDAYMAGYYEVPVSCTDGVQGQDETGIDCGGPLCASCLEQPATTTPENSDVGYYTFVKIISYPNEIRQSINSAYDFTVTLKNEGDVPVKNLFIEFNNDWFSFDKKRISLGPGDTESIPVSLNIPESATAGSYQTLLSLKGDGLDTVSFVLTVVDAAGVSSSSETDTETVRLGIEQLKKKIDIFSKQGYDTSAAEELANNADTLFKKGSVLEALGEIAKANEALDTADNNTFLPKTFLMAYVFVGLIISSIILAYYYYKKYKRQKLEALDIRHAVEEKNVE